MVTMDWDNNANTKSWSLTTVLTKVVSPLRQWRRKDVARTLQHFAASIVSTDLTRHVRASSTQLIAVPCQLLLRKTTVASPLYRFDCYEDRYK